MIIRILLLIDREEFRGLKLQGCTDLQNRRECGVALTVLDQADEGAVEAGELGEFFLGELPGFSLFLEDFAEDLFFVRGHLRRDFFVRGLGLSQTIVDKKPVILKI